MSDTPTTEEPPSIHVLMSRVQADIGAVGKNSSGDVPYKFRGIDAVVNALNPAMVKHGVFCLPEVRHYEHERLANGRAHMVMLTVAYRFYGPGGDYVEAVGIGESVDYSDKATNQAMSMAYKYAMTEAFCIRTADMTDADARSVEIPEHTQPARADGKAKRSGGAPAKKANPETGEIEHNLTKKMLDSIAGPGRQKFMEHIEKEHKVKISAVPESQREAIEKAIGDWGADRPFAVDSAQ
jgi:hypothetical protein